MKGRINLESVITGLTNDNDSSIEELFDYYYPRLYNFSKSIIKTEDCIDDIIQEVFVKIWQNRKKIKSAETFNSFIFTITRNLLLNELRRRLNSSNLKEEIKKRSLAPEYSSFENLEYKEISKEVENAIAGLPSRQKEIFLLSRNEGLSHKEIAEKLNVSPKTVEYHISLAIKVLRERLGHLGLMLMLYLNLFY